jgi:hypothetical protein
MATAAVINPIPNAPVALAAGAAFDHFRGGMLLLLPGYKSNKYWKLKEEFYVKDHEFKTKVQGYIEHCPDDSDIGGGRLGPCR